VEEEFISADELEAAPRGPRHDRRYVRLAELVHRAHLDEDRQKSVRNLFQFLTKEFPGETLPILQRLLPWDETGNVRFFYAKAALERNQPKLAHKAVLPLLDRHELSENMLLLAARVFARAGNPEEARALLGRLSPASKLTTGIAQVNALLGQVEHERNAI
jgi:hypothetical protein